MMIQITRQRTPVEAQIVTADGAAADVANMINSEVFRNQVVQALAAQGVARDNVAGDLSFLRALAKRPDLLEVRVLSNDETTGKKLVDAVTQEVLRNPIRFRLGELGRRHALYSAVRDHAAECARASVPAAGGIGTAQLMQIKLQSLFLAASLLRELENQGPSGNFLKHLDAMRLLGLERLPADLVARSHGDFDVLYSHALCESTHALASAQYDITDNLVKTQYRVLHAASAQPEAPGRSAAKNLMLVVPAGLIAAWLMLQWRGRRRARDLAPGGPR